MPPKRGNYDSDILRELSDVSRKVKNMEKILMGNGTEGLMRKMEMASDAIIEIKSYNHLKVWILGGIVAFLMTIITGLITYIILK